MMKKIHKQAYINTIGFFRILYKYRINEKLSTYSSDKDSNSCKCVKYGFEFFHLISSEGQCILLSTAMKADANVVVCRYDKRRKISEILFCKILMLI
jgi:hypothetical protein